jgi:O-antigen ligase
MIFSHKLFPLIMLCVYAVLSLSSMAGMNISFLFVALTFVYLLFSNARRLPMSLQMLPEFKLYLRYGGILFFACLLSLVVAKIAPVIYADHAPDVTVHGFLKIWYLFCPLILASVFLWLEQPRQSIDLVKNVWWAMTLFLSVVAVIQFFTGWPIAQEIPTNLGHYHAILFFGHHLSTASIIIFPTFVALAQSIGTYLREKKIDRLACATSLAGILILFLTYARTAWLSVPIGLLILFFRYLKPKARFASIFGLLAILLAASQTTAIKERLTNSMGITDRFRLWQANIDFFKHNPITGIGWLKTQEMSEFYFKQLDPLHYHDYFWGHAHSNFFEMLGGTGLIGLFAFLAWTFFTFKLAYDAANDRTDPVLADFAYGLGVALVLLHINGLTNVTFWEGKVMHQQMFAVAWLLVIRALQKQTERPAPPILGDQ